MIEQTDLDGLRDAILSTVNEGAQVVGADAINAMSMAGNATYVLRVPNGGTPGTPGAAAVQRLTDRVNNSTAKLCSPSGKLCADGISTREETQAPATTASTTAATTTSTSSGGSSGASAPEDENLLIYYIIAGVGGALLLVCCIVIICVVRKRSNKPKAADPAMDYLDENSHTSQRPAEPASRADLMIEFVSDLTSSSDSQ